MGVVGWSNSGKLAEDHGFHWMPTRLRLRRPCARDWVKGIGLGTRFGEASNPGPSVLSLPQDTRDPPAGGLPVWSTTVAGGNVCSEEVIIKRLPRTAVPDMLGQPATVNPMRGKIVDHYPLEGVKLWTVSEEKVRQRRQWLSGDLQRLKGCFFWMFRGNLPEGQGRFEECSGAKVSDLSNIAKYAKGKILEVGFDVSKVQWKDEVAPSEVRTINILRLASVIRDTENLDFQVIDDVEEVKKYLMPKEGQIRSVVDYKRLPRFHDIRAMHIDQYRLLMEILADADEGRHSETVTFEVLAGQQLLDLASIKIPKVFDDVVFNMKGRISNRDFTTKYTWIEARELILMGGWRIFREDLKAWYNYYLKKAKGYKGKPLEGPPIRRIMLAERLNQYSRLRGYLKQTESVAEANMKVVRAKHPPRAPVRKEIWQRCQRCFEDFQKDKKKRLPDQISDAHLELMIKMLRELDPMSTGSLDGLDYNIIKKTVRQVSPLEIPGTARQKRVDKASMFIINTIYNVALGKVDEDAAILMRACRLIMIGKKDGGQRPISVGQVYRRLAGGFS